MMGYELPAELVREQAQCERSAGSLLTKICHEQSALERQRLLSLAFWHAGRASAFEDEAERIAGENADAGARGSRR
jgi:hypothetical protein